MRVSSSLRAIVPCVPHLFALLDWQDAGCNPVVCFFARGSAENQGHQGLRRHQGRALRKPCVKGPRDRRDQGPFACYSLIYRSFVYLGR